jgi:hypothetical protein
MTRMRVALWLLTAVIPGLIIAPIASAQDVMQLDLMFKDSLSQGKAPRDEEKRAIPRQRHQAGDAQGRIGGQRRAQRGSASSRPGG